MPPRSAVTKRVQLNFSLRGYKSPVRCRPQVGLLPLDYFFFGAVVPCDDVGFEHALMKGEVPELMAPPWVNKEPLP
jgi:hypothetical protein